MSHPFGAGDLLYLIAAARWTILLSLIAFLGGGLGGALIAVLRISPRALPRTAAILYIRLFQGTPLLMQLFIAFFLPSILEISVDPLPAAAAALTLNASAFLGEIWRGSIESIPRGQWEAASALGIRRVLQLRLIILPQAVRVAIPPTVGFLVQLVKATSLAAIIGFTELTRAGQVLVSSTFRPFLVFSIVAALYFVLCWPLSLLSGRLERRLGAIGVRAPELPGLR